MSQETLADIIDKAVADYGFRLAVMWGTEDVIAGAGLSEGDADALRSAIVPELKRLPDPVEPDDRAREQARLRALAVAPQP